jgi:hypothetical protein
MEITTSVIYHLELSEKELKVITQALGVVAGIQEIKPKPEDVVQARDLNIRLLKIQTAEARQKLAVAEGKLDKAVQHG